MPLTPYKPPPEVVTPDAILNTSSFSSQYPDDAEDLDSDDTWADEWAHILPTPTAGDLAAAMLDDMRTAATQCEEIGGPAREVGRWLHARIRHHVLKAGL